MNQDYQFTPQNDQSQFSPFDTNLTPPRPTGHAKGFSIASLSLGIASVVVCCCCCCLYYIAIALAVVAIVMACLAKRDNGGKMPPMAIAGMILAIIGIVLFLCFIAFEVFFNSMSDEELAAMLDPFFQEAYGMSFEEFMEQMESGMLE